MQMGAGMFTVRFCTGEEENGEDDATHEQILAWAETQIRERLCGNHTHASGNRLTAEYPNNPVFQRILAELWIVNSQVPKDNRLTKMWGASENVVAQSGKKTSTLERVIQLHKQLELMGFFTKNVKLDEFGDIIYPRTYFKELIKECAKNWMVDYSTVTNILAIARAYGEEYKLLIDIMRNKVSKGSKSGGSAGCFFHVGSSGVLRQLRIIAFAKLAQKAIDTSQLKAIFLGHKQFRALQKATLDMANDITFDRRNDWSSWTDLLEHFPLMNEREIETSKPFFKPTKTRNAKKDSNETMAVPDDFRQRLVVLFQRQAHANSLVRVRALPPV